MDELTDLKEALGRCSDVTQPTNLDGLDKRSKVGLTDWEGDTNGLRWNIELTDWKDF